MNLTRTLRVVCVTLLLALGVPLVAPDTASAMPAPDWVCEPSGPPELVLIQCGDEAAAFGMSVGPFIAEVWPLVLIFGGAVVLAWMSDDTPSLEECRFYATSELMDPGDCDPLAYLDGDGDSFIQDLVDLAGGFTPEEIEFLCALFPAMAMCAPAIDEEWWYSQTQEPVAAGELGVDMMRNWVVASGTAPPWSSIFVGELDEATFGDGIYHSVLRQDRPTTSLYVDFAIKVDVGADTITGKITTNGTAFNSYTATVPFGEWGEVFAAAWVNTGGSSQSTWLRLATETWLGTAITFVGSLGAASGWKQMDAYVNTNLYTTITAITTWAGMTWQGTGTVPSQAEMTAMLTDLPSIFPGTPDGEPEVLPDIFPDPGPAPSSPPDPTPVPDVDPAPAPEPEPYEPVTEGSGDQGLFDQLANRIGGMFDGLGSLIGGAFGWLGDLLTGLFEWLVDRLWQMFRWLFDNLAALLEWLGDLLGLIYSGIENLTRQLGLWFRGLYDLMTGLIGWLGDLLAGLLGSVIDLLGMVWEAIVGLPAAILDGLADLLEFLFVPEGTALEPVLQECGTSFPCSWVQEVIDSVEAAADLTGTAGGCTAPSLGWTEFRVSFPPPAGCSAAAGSLPATGAEDVGDLFGYRVALRSALLVAIGLAFIFSVLRLTPWGDKFDKPVSPHQESVMA